MHDFSALEVLDFLQAEYLPLQRGQPVYEQGDDLQFIFGLYPLLAGSHLPSLTRLFQFVLAMPPMVEGNAVERLQRQGLHIRVVVQTVAHRPEPEKSLLHDVLGVGIPASEARSLSEQPLLQAHHLMAKSFYIHRRS